MNLEAWRGVFLVAFMAGVIVYTVIRLLISKDKIENILCFITILLVNILIEVMKR